MKRMVRHNFGQNKVLRVFVNLTVYLFCIKPLRFRVFLYIPFALQSRLLHSSCRLHLSFSFLTNLYWPNRCPTFMFCWPCILIDPCNEMQLDALFILRSFRQSTSTCFGYICSPSSGGILCIYIYATIGTCCAQHVPIVVCVCVCVYIWYTSWWWATNMPETCRGWLTK